MSSNYKIKADIKEAKTMADELGDYVRGDQLYGNTGGSFFSNMPGLTVGALLMRLRRLDTLRDSLSDSQNRDLDIAITAWEKARDEWRLHYEQKMIRELDSRLDSMQTFFKECAESSVNCRNNYRPEILKRTIIQELLREMNQLNVEADVQAKVELVDGKFHSYMRPDEFQWSDELQAVYPQNEFWWLYQKPPQDDNK